MPDSQDDLDGLNEEEDAFNMFLSCDINMMYDIGSSYKSKANNGTDFKTNSKLRGGMPFT